MNLNKNRCFLLSLLKKALWDSDIGCVPSDVDWDSLVEEARVQSVVPFVYASISSQKGMVQSSILRKLRTVTIAGVVRNDYLLGEQKDILKTLTDADIPLCILKGSSIARYYPMPDYRMLGDIDILVKKEYLQKAEHAIKQMGFAKCEEDTGFHIAYRHNDVVLELHYAFSEYPDSKGGQIAKNVAQTWWKNIEITSVSGYEFPVLAEKHQVLSILLHMEHHMVGMGIGLRQLCDWAMYIINVDEIVWKKDIAPLLKQCGLYQYAKVLTKTCVKYIGLKQDAVSWCAEADEELCDALLIDIFNSGNMGTASEENLQSLFTDKTTLGMSRNNAVKDSIAVLNQRIYQYFPYIKKHKFLLPVYWLYVPIRYVFRTWSSKRSVMDVLKTEKRRNALYKELKLFEVEN